jgi:hypothetical protein
MTASMHPSNVQTSEATGMCAEMFAATKHRLQKHAWRQATVYGKQNYEFVMVCIQVYSQWRDIVDILFPNTEWPREHDEYIGPLALASVIGWSICGTIANRYPSVATEALNLPPQGYVKAFVLSKEGATVHHIKPDFDCDSN